MKIDKKTLTAYMIGAMVIGLLIGMTIGGSLAIHWSLEVAEKFLDIDLNEAAMQTLYTTYGHQIWEFETRVQPLFENQNGSLIHSYEGN